MKATLRFLDLNITKGIVTMMVGIKQVEITMNEYQALKIEASDYRSGLERVGNAFKFISTNAMFCEGRASVRYITKMINR